MIENNNTNPKIVEELSRSQIKPFAAVSSESSLSNSEYNKLQNSKSKN